jgi:hypothetical protein
VREIAIILYVFVGIGNGASAFDADIRAGVAPKDAGETVLAAVVLWPCFLGYAIGSSANGLLPNPTQ